MVRRRTVFLRTNLFERSTSDPASISTRHAHRRSNNNKGILNEDVVKYMVYLCMVLFVVVLYFTHVMLPSNDLQHPGRLPLRLRQVLRLDASNNNNNLLLSSSSSQALPRIAIVLPFVTKERASIPPYLGIFCATARGASSLVDFFIFHPGVLDDYAQRNSVNSNNRNSNGATCPPNVKFINLQSMEHFASNYLMRVMDERNEDDIVLNGSKETVARILTKHLLMYPYALVEWKPTFGHVFAEFLTGYSHWGYSDFDILFGDLPRWITTDELQNFDIVTYGYGDQNRVYLRGQFTFHRNIPKVNQLWRECAYLSHLDERFAKVLAGEEKMKFESAEGCYSAAVLERRDLRVKYAVKAFTDTLVNKDTVYSHGLYIGMSTSASSINKNYLYYHNYRQRFFPAGLRSIGSNSNTAKTVVIYKAQTTEDGLALLQTPQNWFEKDAVYKDSSRAIQWEIGRKEVIELNDLNNKDGDKVNCMYWAQKKYQSRLCVSPSHNVTEHDTVYWINGRLFKQRYENAKLDSKIETAPFFHFQEWKRYYREAQLATLRADTDLSTFVLTKEGAIPVFPPTRQDDRQKSLLKRGAMMTPLGKSASTWLASTSALAGTAFGTEMDRSVLPRRSYCLRSAPRKFPPAPPAPACQEQVSWWDKDRVHILSQAPSWSSGVDYSLDVTLVMTLQVPSYQTNDFAALDRLMDMLVANLNRWQGQPCVLIFHIALSIEGASEVNDVLALMDARLGTGSDTSRGRGKASEDEPLVPTFGTGACLIAVMFGESAAETKAKNDQHQPPPPYHVSRKALLNMATDAAPTRWFLSGLELERGMMLSMDAAFFAHRAVLARREIAGNVFWIPQFALEIEDDFRPELTLTNLIGFQEQGEVVKDAASFEVGLCEDGDHLTPKRRRRRRLESKITRRHGKAPERIFDEAKRLWWDLAKNIVREGSAYVTDEAFTRKRAEVHDNLQQNLLKLLTAQEMYDLFAMDESPVLLVDNVGPRSGMMTHELVREVEEFGGKQCYNGLRLAQLATFGYNFNVLSGAFAASTATSRSVVFDDASNGGDFDDTILGGSRCDGCFMFDQEHESILEAIALDERKRPAKACALWEEPAAR